MNLKIEVSPRGRVAVSIEDLRYWQVDFSRLEQAIQRLIKAIVAGREASLDEAIASPGRVAATYANGGWPKVGDRVQRVPDGRRGRVETVGTWQDSGWLRVQWDGAESANDLGISEISPVILELVG